MGPTRGGLSSGRMRCVMHGCGGRAEIPRFVSQAEASPRLRGTADSLSSCDTLAVTNACGNALESAVHGPYHVSELVLGLAAQREFALR
jgi:hypothetical protein